MTNATLLERSRIRFPAHFWVDDSMILTFSQQWDIYPRSQGGSLLLILGPNEQKNEDENETNDKYIPDK